MGFGDVKFMALVGAFLGWKAVLFTVLAASVLGAAVALASRVTGREEWGSKIPFGPWLALGATIWIFYGPEFLDWYFGLIGRSGGL
ncbi:MAG: A24 family peptidase [Verrucomicrobiales bacterium]